MSVVKRNLGWLLLSQGATWIVSIVVLLIAPRELGDEAFGQITFAQAYVYLFELLALFGTGTYLTKALARDTASVGRYLFNTLLLKVLVTTMLIGVALGLASGLGYDRETILLIGAFCVGLFFNALTNVLMGGLQGLQRMGRPALWDGVRSVVGSLLGLTVLMNGGSLLAYALVFNLACAIPFVANLIYLRSTIRASSKIDVTLWRRVLFGGFPFFVLSALTVFYGTIDIPLLEAFAGNEEVGWYGLAYRWVSMPVFFAGSVSLAFFPALSVEGVRPNESFAKLANRALYVVALVAIPAALGIALIAHDFLTALYGSEFEQAVPLMQLLALHIPIVGLDMVLGTIVVASDRQRQWVLISVAAAIMNPALNLVAIPYAARTFDNAAIGAAGVTVLTEVLILLGALRLRPAGVLDRSTAKLLLRIVAASLTMVPVLVAVASAPLGVRILAGALTYGLASLALGAISVGEIRGFGTAFLHRRQPQTTTVP